MKRIYRNIAILFCMSLAACSTDNELEQPFLEGTGEIADGSVKPNPYWGWVVEFPGMVTNEEPRVETRLTIEAPVNAGDTSWRSTGLYFAPGDTVVVQVDGAAGNAYYRIGGFTDVLGESLAPFKRYPDMNVIGKLQEGENHLISYFGGHFYVYYKGAGSNLALQVKGAVQSPDYILGETDVTAWKAQLETTQVPFGELRGKQVTFTLPLATLKRVTDPEALLSFYDEFIAEDCDGLFGNRLGDMSLRLRSDIQLNESDILDEVGGQYPIVVNRELDSIFVAFPSLSSSSDFSVCQAFALPYSFEKITAKLFRSAYYGLNYFRLCDRNAIVPAHTMTSAVNSFLNNDDPAKRFNDLQTDVRTVLFVQLAQQYGWNIFGYISEEMLKDNGGEDEQNQRDAVAMYACEYAGENLAPFFEDWGVVLSSVAYSYMEQFPAVSEPFWENYVPKAGNFDDRTPSVKNRVNWPEYRDADRTGWTASSTVVIGGVETENMHEESNGKIGPFSNLFDGDDATIWHSLWKKEGGRYPHVLMIDMQQEQTFNYLYFVQRNTTDPSNKCRRFQIFVKEGDDWKGIDNGKIFTLGKDAEMQRVFLGDTYCGSELRLVLLSPHPAEGEQFNDSERQTVPVSLGEFGVGLLN